jgi:hypothetical protein
VPTTQLPADGVTDRTVTPAGSASLNVTFCAVDGPPLLTDAVQLIVWPGVAVPDEAVTAAARSDVASMVTLSCTWLSFGSGSGVSLRALLVVSICCCSDAVMR